MRFLVPRDYERLITIADLNQVYDVGNGTTYTVAQRILDTEPIAQEEISSYLKQRYDVSLIFTDSGTYSGSATYYGNSRVQYTATAWDAATTYAANARISYLGSIYSSVGVGNINHLPTNTTYWTFVCLDNQLFYGNLPCEQFQYGTSYAINKQVWHTDNHRYTSKVNDNTYPVTNTDVWTDNGVYSFTATLPTDGTKWTMGDNRNPLIVQHMVDVALYHAHATINKRNIPELRIMRYMGDGKEPNVSAVGWLKEVASGRLNATLPELSPAIGELSFRYGNGNVNNIPTPPMSY